MGTLVNWLKRHNAVAVVILSLLIIVAVISGSARRGLLSPDRLGDGKDALSALSSIINITAILAAAGLSYFRFFAGRTFARRAELSIEVETLRASDGACLHSLMVKLANIGTLTIHDAQLSVLAIDHRAGSRSSRSTVEGWLSNDEFASENLEAVIDPGETEHFHTVRMVRSPILGTSYAAVVRDRSGNVWRCFALGGSDT